MPESIIFIVLLIFVGGLIFFGFTKQGKGLMFGGRIIKTYDGVSAKRKIYSNKVKVHVVDSGATKFVGLEISVASIGSYQMIPVSFTANEARQLAELLIEAAEYRENTWHDRTLPINSPLRAS